MSKNQNLCCDNQIFEQRTGLLVESTDKYDNLKRIVYEIYAF